MSKWISHLEALAMAVAEQPTAELLSLPVRDCEGQIRFLNVQLMDNVLINIENVVALCLPEIPVPGFLSLRFKKTMTIMT